MDAREQPQDSAKTWDLCEAERQSHAESNGGASSSLLPNEHGDVTNVSSQTDLSKDDDDISDGNDDKDEQNQYQLQQLNIDDVGKYEGISKLRELANSARADSCRSSGGDPEDLCTPQDHITKSDEHHTRNLNTPNFLVNAEDVSSDSARMFAEEAAVNLSPHRRQLPTGPLTRGARKTLEAALAKSLGYPPSSHAGCRTHEPSTLSAPSPFLVVASPAPSTPFTITSTTDDTTFRSSSSAASPSSSPISRGVQCSPHAAPLSGSLFDIASSLFATDTCTQDAGGRKGKGSNSPDRWDICDKKMAQDDLDDHTDMVSFITEAMDSSDCGTDGMDRDEPDSEWVMDTNAPASPQTPTSEMRELKTPNTTPVATVSRADDARRLSQRQSGAPSCLLITDNKDDTALQNTIQEALETCVRTATLKESVELCKTELFGLIWVRVAVPVRKELLTAVAAIRYSSGKSKGAYIIAIADKNLLVDLLLRLFDDVFLEPLPLISIRQKYAKLCRRKDTRISGCEEENEHSQELNTPESSLSLDSFKSQSTPSDGGMDFRDLALEPLKTSPQTNSEPRSCIAFCKRVRIKDSCDQLRKLLPYVRGRKTDMASILEMTVDYLKIVNSALPLEFQTKVIEMLSPDLPHLEGRISHTDIGTVTGKCKAKLVEPAAPSKTFHITGKLNQNRTSSSSSASSILTGRNLNVNANFSSNNNNNKTTTTNNNDNNNGIEASTNSVGVMTRSKTCKALSEVDRTRNTRISSGSNQLKSDTILFSALNQPRTAQPEADSNANIVHTGDNADGKQDTATAAGKLFPKRELPLNANIVGSTAKRPHMVMSNKPKDKQTSVVYLPPGAITPLKSTKDIVFDNASNQSHRFSGIQFPHMFTDGDISANRMFSTGHVSGSEVFPYQAHSYFNPAGPPRFPGVSAEGGEMVASVNSMYFDTAYYYYPSLHDSNNGNYFVGNGGVNEYVNPNAVLPMTSNNATKVTNFNIGRRYERMSVSGECERFGLTETTIGTSQQQQQQLQQQHHQ